jgi:hypothetical protein
MLIESHFGLCLIFNEEKQTQVLPSIWLEPGTGDTHGVGGEGEMNTS